VLIHGIGPVDKQTGFIDEWLTSLCAGSPASVEQRLRDVTKVAYYRDWDWVDSSGAQGVGHWTPGSGSSEQEETIELVATAWLEAAAASSDQETKLQAIPLLQELRQAKAEGSQGVESAVRIVAAQLAGKLPFLAEGTFDFVQRMVWDSLWQVAAYANDEHNSKQEIWNRFDDARGPDTRIVLAHSLGTVVAYEAIRHFDLEVDLFMTTGAPLGLDTVIYHKLIPDAAYPPSVKRWVNVADRDDFVAADPELADRFPDSTGAGRKVEDMPVRNSGPLARHHAITEYLKHDKVRSIFWEVFDG
jgi:hypothetical protein